MLSALSCLAALTFPQQETKPVAPEVKPAAAAQKPPSGAVARKGDLRATLERKGRLVPVDAAPVRVEFEAYQGELLVVEVTPHGRPVNRGDVLLRFDTKKIDEQLRRAEFDLEQAKKRLENADEERRLADVGAQDELTKAESRLQWSRRRLQGFLEFEIEFDKESERLSRQSTLSRLEDQQDELTQLEKMYKEDELVDATEEIVLKRSRRDFASSQAWAKLSERRTKYEWDFDKPMARERLEQETAMEGRAMERLRKNLELARTGRELGQQRTRFDFDKQKQALDDLRADRERFTVRAGCNSLLLHGEVDAAPGKGIEVGNRLGAGPVLMTIADPDRLEIRTDVPETHLFRATTGKAAEVELTALPGQKLAGAIRVELLPNAREGDLNLYRTVVPLAAADPRYRPGMGCKVTIVLDQVKDAVLVPLAAIVSRDGQKYVRAGSSDKGPFDERKVALGPDDGKDVVVERGVAAGEFVVVEEAKK